MSLHHFDSAPDALGITEATGGSVMSEAVSLLTLEGLVQLLVLEVDCGHVLLEVSSFGTEWLWCPWETFGSMFVVNLLHDMMDVATFLGGKEADD